MYRNFRRITKYEITCLVIFAISENSENYEIAGLTGN